MTRRRAPRRWQLRHVHSSSRFDRSPLSLLRAVRVYLTRAAVITLTETTREPRTRVLRSLPGYDLLKVAGIPGAGDPAVLVRRRRLEVIWVKRWVLSEQRYDLGASLVVAVAVLLRDRHSGRELLVTVAHLPARLHEDRNLAVWRDALETWGILVHAELDVRPDLRVLLTGDFNLCARSAGNRREINRLLDVPGLASSWGRRVRALPEQGTHGQRLIDDTWSNMPLLRVDLLPDDPSSDHRPYRDVFEIGR